MSDHSFKGDTSPNGSTAGMKISGYYTNVNTAFVGNANYDNETGILVPNAIVGGTFYIKATGFSQTSDRIVKIQNAGLTGTTWVIHCGGADKAVTIPADWNSSNSITVIKEGVVTQLIAGNPYDGNP
jgi:hypothetical protein